ncbi:MAG: hypothetical protein ACJAXN_001346 [Psychromonas sp.]|jgi:hypothetical protein
MILRVVFFSVITTKHGLLLKQITPTWGKLSLVTITPSNNKASILLVNSLGKQQISFLFLLRPGDFTLLLMAKVSLVLLTIGDLFQLQVLA